MRLLACALLLIPALAGCTAEPKSYHVAGSFHAEPRPDWDDWNALVVRYTDDDVVIMESFPEQFRVTGMTAAGCEEFRQDAADRAYVASVSECRLDRS